MPFSARLLPLAGGRTLAVAGLTGSACIAAVALLCRPTARLAPATSSGRLLLPGTVATDIATPNAPLTGPTSGWALEPGQPFRKGDLLLQVEASRFDVEIDMLRAQIPFLERAVADADERLDRERQAGQPDLIPQLEASLQLARAQRDVARAHLNRATILARAARVVAPFDGVVVDSAVERHAWVDRGRPLGVLLRAGPPTVEFDLPPQCAGRVVAGVPVSIQDDHGSVHRAVIDGAPRPDRASARLLADASTLRPGTPVQVAVDLFDPQH